MLSRAILRGRGKHQTGLGQAKRGLRGSAPAKCSAHFPFLSSSHPVRDFSLLQLSKFLPNATKEQEAYKAQRTKTTMLYDMDAVAGAAGRNGPPTDPIAAALAAHGV